jgi:60 kDa SS-A/Ro ribonucleoprotein
MPNVFSRNLGTPATQMEQARPDQVTNNAGGFVFEVSDRSRLERFLMIGTEGGTYYVDEKKLTKDNTQFLINLIAREEELVEAVVVEVSESGRAYRQSPAIFTMAALFAFGKRKNKDAFNRVVRTSTHLFEFAEYVELLGGWGRSKRSAVASWYEGKTVDQLAYQAVKYRQRNGWTHKDLFRLSHPVGVDQNLGKFILGKESEEIQSAIVYGFKAAQNVTSAAALVDVLGEFPNLPWEAIPTQFHKEVDVWKKLFYNGQLKGQALLRNITRLARLGAFNDMVFARDYATRLTDPEMMQATRLHPIQYLLALNVHEEGQVWKPKKVGDTPPLGYRQVNGQIRVKDWVTNPVIKDALNAGFYLAFKYVEPTGKRTFIGLDVSGSMSTSMSGLDLSCAMVAAAMAMSIAKVEPYYQIYGFSDGSPYFGGKYVTTQSYNRSVLAELSVTPNMDLNTVMRNTADQNFGRTDCALPMLYAAEHNIEVDTFAIFTDNETWFGKIHPFQALRTYRQKMGIDAKLVVAALTASPFSIADPSDRGMLDVVGADANLPSLVANFSAGRI